MTKKNKKYDQYSDEELLNLFNDTNENQYFGYLYDRYLPMVYGVCLKYLKDIEKTKDAVMNIYEMLTLRISFYEVRSFKPWLYQVVKNHCIQQLKEKKDKFSLEYNSDIMESDPILSLLSEEENSENNENSENSEKLLKLENCIEKLPETQKNSIKNFFFSKKSYAEISENTGFELRSIKSFIQNGKRNLKICLEENG